MRLALLIVAVMATPLPATAETFVVHASSVPDEKAIVATVEPVHELTARARIGGTIASLSIKEGDRVAAGAEVASVADPKLVLQGQALDSRIDSQQSQRDKAQSDYDRAVELQRRGVNTQVQVDAAKTALDVAERTLDAMRSDRDVIAQQMKEGAVLAPGAGRVLRVPVSEGSVILPGETIATIAEDHYILRLQLPERHARFMRAGDVVKIGGRGLAEDGPRSEGRVRLVYPEIQGGRVIADVEVGRGGRLFRRRANPGLCRDRRTARDHHPARLRLPARRSRLREAQGRRRSCRPARLARWPDRRSPRRAQGRRRDRHAMKLGISGVLTRTFINSPLTPLLLLAALVAGAIALVSLPREEEPQISVPMVDIIVPANGYKADQAVELVTRPLEDIIKGIDGVEHVYSQTKDDSVLVTARFLVGTDQDVATLRVHEKIRAHIGDLPKGIPEPLIVGRGINDVAIVTLTLSASPEQAARWTDNGLFQVAEELQHELSKVDNIGATYIVGGSPSQIRVEPDPERLSVFGVTLNQLVDKISNANRSFEVGAFRDKGKSMPVLAGQTLQGVPDIGLLLLTTRDGRPVYVKDVANVVVGAAQPEHRAWMMTRGANGELRRSPAVTLAIAKRKGANAVAVADDVLKRLEVVRGRVVPAGIDIAVTRNYGETATEKANELLFHLALATVSIVALITVAIGWREGVVVLIVIPTTILLTLFASWMMGYTINRVSLFALIFSIGILVDDAIVIVENIARHWGKGGKRDPAETAVEAVAEVGNPTIVATLTIVAALLPMMFVSGMMGPYMSPIPANASIAMLFSFFVAVTVTPWLLLRFAGRKAAVGDRRRPSRDRRDGPLLCPHRRAAAERPLAVEGLPARRRRRHRRRLRAVRHQGRAGETLAVR